APEKELTLFALRAAVLEKTATLIGTLAFIWATVVLLGGFAVTLDRTDFWFVTVILVIEGTRIFSRSHELEWQHQATWSITDVGIRAVKLSSSFVLGKLNSAFKGGDISRKNSTPPPTPTPPPPPPPPEEEKVAPTEERRTWRSSEVPLLPLLKWIFLSKHISRFLYWIQLVSAVTCVVLSMLKLVRRNYGPIPGVDPYNRNTALIIFYSLALSEAVVFLMERCYWEWNLRVVKLLEKVNGELELGDSSLVSTRRFFYDSYSMCINGSIFDGLKMDMVSFSTDLLDSDSPDEQLIGARTLRKFSINPRFSDDALQKIGTDLPVMARLLEMLNWKDADQQEIRYSAAEIVAKLAGKLQNSLRIAEIPGVMESISSLLDVSRDFIEASDQISEKMAISDTPWTFNQLGLQILKKLARNRDICGKIGNTRGLLPKIIDFLHTDEQLLRQATAAAPSKLLTVKRSLQVIKLLSTTSGEAGKHLRREISDVIFTASYIREILRHGDNQPDLQLFGIQILTNLAIEENATEKIGRTGGVVRVLFTIFFNDKMPANRIRVRTAAGEALAMLSLKSKNVCHKILKLKHKHDELIRSLKDPMLRVNSARILRNLCAYSGDDCGHLLQGLTAAAPTILEAVVKEENKLQEVMLGAASSLFKFMDNLEAQTAFEESGIEEIYLVHHLFNILNKYDQPSVKVPGIRRYAIELCIWMMRRNEANVRSFRSSGMAEELVSVAHTTSELESFNIFCGAVGVYRHRVEMDSLVETALELLQG
ncbi:hypothetical protein M569_05019, partial [Genlisea aurea]